MIYNRIFDVKSSYYGYISAAYSGILTVSGRGIYTKCWTNEDNKGVYHTSFSSWLKPSGWSVPRFKIQKLSCFFIMNLSSNMILYISVTCLVRKNV